MVVPFSDVSANILTRPLAVIGAGTQGRRIALMLASQGGEVRVYSRSEKTRAEAKAFIEENLPEIVERVSGSLGTIRVCDSIAAAVADTGLVIEATPEQKDLKVALLAELDKLAPVDAIISSNSSSYPTSQLIGQSKRPNRILNTHFYMPPVQCAVELMSSGQTHPDIIAALLQVFPLFGLEPYHVQTESIGFIFNRVWAAIKRESLAVVSSGVARPEDVDKIFKSNLCADEQPFRLMDKIGLDVVLDVEERYAAEHPEISEAPRILLRSYVEKGWLGKKTGRGFYNDY